LPLTEAAEMSQCEHQQKIGSGLLSVFSGVTSSRKNVLLSF